MGGGSMRSSTETIIGALRILANDIKSEVGVANAAIWEAADRMEELCSELLFQKQLAEKYVEAGKICAKIYIARNITLSEKCVVSALAEIDKVYRTQHDGN
jgi:hypothetical protein